MGTFGGSFETTFSQRGSSEACRPVERMSTVSPPCGRMRQKRTARLLIRNDLAIEVGVVQRRRLDVLRDVGRSINNHNLNLAGLRPGLETSVTFTGAKHYKND